VAGNVDLGAIGWLLIGSIPGVLIGSQVSVRLPERGLRLAIALALGLSGLKLLDVPHANAIVVVALGALLAGVAAWGIRAFRSEALVERDRPGGHHRDGEAAAGAVEAGRAERRGQAGLTEQSLEGAREA
jgi:hypothetical protein